MQKLKKRFLFVSVVGLLLPSFGTFAQTTGDVLVFDNTSGDFLLPSYFDQSPSTSSSNQNLTFSAPAPAYSQTQVPSDVDILREIFGDSAQTSQVLNIQTPSSSTSSSSSAKSGQTFYPRPKQIQTQVATPQQPLLTPLPPLPTPPEKQIAPPKRNNTPSAFAAKVVAKETGTSKTAVTLPKDIRLQFPKGQALLTPTVIKWVTAYALHVKKDPRLLIEIRVSNRDWAVQKSRLTIIMQQMLEQGLNAKKIRIYQSDRDPDTLIIGYETDPNQTKIVVPTERTVRINEQKTLSW